MGALKRKMPVQTMRLPSQFGCCEICHTPASQNLLRVDGSRLNIHFCASAADSRARPMTNVAMPVYVTHPPKAGRPASGTPQAIVCGRLTMKPQRKEIIQKPKAPVVVESVSSSRMSRLFCSAR